jgi:hypothetical protein
MKQELAKTQPMKAQVSADVRLANGRRALRVPMANYLFLAAVVLLCAGLARAQTEDKKVISPKLERRLVEFFSQQEALARTLAEQENKKQHPEVWNFFDAGKRRDWERVDRLYRILRRGAYQFEGGRKDDRLLTTVWQAVNESFGAYGEISHGDEYYVSYFAQQILDSMPTGSIYFGGTDPGRWLVTLFCKSHERGEPCFVLTQNALADALYLQYLRALYGKRIQIPSDEDAKKAFNRYTEDAKKRLHDGKLKPGENVFEDDDGKVEVSGQTAVMQMNGRLAQTIFENNPKRQFFIEESFPLDWMYPYLMPHGLIMKLERKPPAELPTVVVEKDRAYWTSLVDRAIGHWLRPETPLKELCHFATNVFENNNTVVFKGDPGFLQNRPAQMTYSKLRSAIGGVYAWRATNTTSAVEKQRMLGEAELAFRQAFALCPYSPEAIFRYSQLLMGQGRKKEALLLAQTAESVSPGNAGIGSLMFQLEEQP